MPNIITKTLGKLKTPSILLVTGMMIFFAWTILPIMFPATRDLYFYLGGIILQLTILLHNKITIEEFFPEESRTKRVARIIKRMNDTIARKSTTIMSTMLCVYTFIVWSIMPLVFPETRDLVFYVSGGIIQLVCLPLIMVGQRVVGRKIDNRAETDHKVLMEQFKLIQNEVVAERESMQKIDEISSKLDQLIVATTKPNRTRPSQKSNNSTDLL